MNRKHEISHSTKQNNNEDALFLIAHSVRCICNWTTITFNVGAQIPKRDEHTFLYLFVGVLRLCTVTSITW